MLWKISCVPSALKYASAFSPPSVSWRTFVSRRSPGSMVVARGRPAGAGAAEAAVATAGSVSGARAAGAQAEARQTAAAPSAAAGRRVGVMGEM